MAAAAPPGSGGVIFMPWLNGSIVPCEDPHVRGGFINLSLGTTRNHLSRAVMEGLAYNNRWTRQAAEKFIGRRIERLRFAGGGALSDLWAQIHADVLGVPILQVEDPVNTTLRGTALAALAALGHRSLADIANLVKIKKVYQPDESTRETYDRMYARYRELFKRNRKIFKALNSQN
jgi:xylulokinase